MENVSFGITKAWSTKLFKLLFMLAFVMSYSIGVNAELMPSPGLVCNNDDYKIETVNKNSTDSLTCYVLSAQKSIGVLISEGVLCKEPFKGYEDLPNPMPLFKLSLNKISSGQVQVEDIVVSSKGEKRYSFKSTGVDMDVVNAYLNKGFTVKHDGQSVGLVAKNEKTKSFGINGNRVVYVLPHPVSKTLCVALD